MQNPHIFRWSRGMHEISSPLTGQSCQHVQSLLLVDEAIVSRPASPIFFERGGLRSRKFAPSSKFSDLFHLMRFATASSK